MGAIHRRKTGQIADVLEKGKTTFLVALAWSTNLVTKPLATGFGGGVTAIGMLIAYINYACQEKKRRASVSVMSTLPRERLPNSILAVLTFNNEHNDTVIRTVVSNAEGKRPVVFLYVGRRIVPQKDVHIMEIVDPYLDDPCAKQCFRKIEHLAQKAKIAIRRFIYVPEEVDAVSQIWLVIHPYDTVMAASDLARFSDINPDRIRYELTQDGNIAHLLKQW